jgi:hypothetical protein
MDNAVLPAIDRQGELKVSMDACAVRRVGKGATNLFHSFSVP